jgi:uncharacterized membrane protein YcaP (DUF421 family)
MTDFLELLSGSFTALIGPGLDPKELSIIQVTIRAIIVFVLAIVVVRCADKRFLSGKTAFDIVLGLILASVLARAINGSAPFLPTIVASFVLVLAHRLLADLSCRWHWLGKLIKGNDNLIIADGHLDEEALKKHNFSKRDLMESLRLEGVDKVEDVETARLERSGDISVIRKQN